MPKNSPVYFKISIALVIIAILILITALKLDKSNNANVSSKYDDVEIVVVESESQAPANQSVENSSDTELNPQTGAATIEELGGTNGSNNLDQLLEGKEINIAE